MHNDAYMFFTECLVLYVQGVRRSIRERLTAELGANWWEWGVDVFLPDGQKANVRDLLRKRDHLAPESSLDPSHFVHVITHNRALTDAFPDLHMAAVDLGAVARLRNQWAHAQELAWSQAMYGAGLMRHILASLNCEEAVRIDEMLQDSSHEKTTEGTNADLEDVAEDPDASETLEQAAVSLEFLYQLQSCLRIRVHVEPLDDAPDGKAKIIVTVFNAAPVSDDLPQVVFKEVRLSSTLAVERTNKDMNIGPLSPGEIQFVEIEAPKRSLLAREFRVRGYLDPDSLWKLGNSAVMPAEALAPIQRQFLTRLAEVGLREFFAGILDSIGAPDESMTLPALQKVRDAVKQAPEQLKAKLAALNELYRDFHANSDSTLGQRMKDIGATLQDFGGQLETLDQAISETNLTQMSESVDGLKLVQLALIRVEDAVQNMAQDSVNNR